ncbi:ATPase, AAA-type, core [Dillenia turbinata]|uniref:ATPase, AAA-type, core n=1 Tax=Dillenia turbinata TaxID=194707 RepID=A0AAN8ZG98_9MAGN
MAPQLPSSQPLVKKYRPKRVQDVAHQDEVVGVVINTLEITDCPHMLFYGPPGTGKTPTAHAIVHQPFGPEIYKSRVLELNASDDHGINVDRTKIKDFAAVAVSSSHHQWHVLKCVVVYNGNLLQGHTIFFICNYISRIIEPLASRCAKFGFKPLSEEIMRSCKLHICQEEGLDLNPEALSTLSSISQGDFCWVITYMQGAACLYGSSISSKDLISVSGVIPEEVVQGLFEVCKSGNFDLANKEVINVIAEGYLVLQMRS